MRSRGVEVHDVVVRARKKMSQPHPCGKIDRVTNRQRMTLDAFTSRPLVEPSTRVAGKFRMMSVAQEPEREAKHLSLATRKSELRINAEDA